VGRLGLVSPLVIAVILVGSRPVYAQAPGAFAYPAPLHRSGKFHLGLSAQADLGMIQGITRHDYAGGVDLLVGARLDLDPHWALRLVTELGAGGFGHGAGYGELAIVPGAVYRYRTADDQTWVPYLGGGLRLGLVGIGNVLVGEPVSIACCHDWGGGGLSGGGGGGHADPDVHTVFTGVSPEVWGGVDLRLADWLSLTFDGALGFERAVSTSVVVLRETIGVRVSL
jgi:hypothetical protein